MEDLLAEVKDKKLKKSMSRSISLQKGFTNKPNKSDKNSRSLRLLNNENEKLKVEAKTIVRRNGILMDPGTNQNKFI